MGVETPNQNALSTICNNSEEIIEDVEQFCYFARVITKNGDAEAILTRPNMLFIGLTAFGRHATLASKPNAIVVPVYACEIWKVTDNISSNASICE